jgi:triphosphoribosyl-dephospho-CoA synthetase
MTTINQIAAAHGITRSAVNKWSKAKRQAIIRDINAGVKVHLLPLISELAALCYKAQIYTGNTVQFYLYPDGSTFSITMMDARDLYEMIAPNCTPMNTATLSGAIAKVEELCK